MKSFPSRLIELLRENKISMYRLATDLECSQSTVKNWCTGKNEPRASEVTKLAQYFDVPTDYLLGLTPNIV